MSTFEDIKEDVVIEHLVFKIIEIDIVRGIIGKNDGTHKYVY